MKPAAGRGIAGGLALAIAATGCAQLDSHSTFTVEPTGAAPIAIGNNPGKIIESALDVKWSQAGNSLELELTEARLCRRIEHEPVVRIEHVDNKIAGGALYWEYGIAAAALSVGLIGLIRPELYSPDTLSDNGTIGKDTATGYRIGGIFTGLGAGVLAIAVYDTVRSRDKDYRTQAYRVSLGEEVACATPELPLDGANVVVSMDAWTATGVSTKQGLVVFRLPAQANVATEAPSTTEETTAPTATDEAKATTTTTDEAGAPAGAPAVAPPPPTEAPTEAPTEVRIAKVAIDGHRPIEIEVVVNYSAAEAAARSGAARAIRISGPPHVGSTSGS